MAYNIVKHRRGTTNDWANIDLAPKEGELVIEELINGNRRCKIGDGATPFSKLPYIDDEISAKLLNELNLLKTDFETQVSEVSDTFMTHLANAKQSIEDLVQNTAETLSTEYKELDSQVTTNLQEQIKQSSSEIRSELNMATTELSQQINTSAASVQSTVTGLLNNSVAALNDQIVTVEKNSSANLNTAIADLEAKINENVQVETIARKEQLQELNKSIQSLEATDKALNVAIETTKTDLNTSIKQLENHYKAELADLSAQLGSTNEVLETVQSDLTTQGNTFSGLITSSKEELAGDYNTKIGNVESELTTLINTTSQAQAAGLETFKNTVAGDLSKLEEESLAKLSQLRTELMEADRLLGNNIEALSLQNGTLTERVNEHINDFLTKVAELADTDSDLATKLSSLQGDVNELSKQISVELVNIEQNYSAKVLQLADELSNNINACQASDTAITNTVLDYVTKFYKEILDLVDDDILILEKVYKVQSELSSRITSLSDTLTAQIASVDSTLTTRINEVEQTLITDLSLVNDTLTEKLENTSSRLAANIESLSAATDLRISDNKKATESIKADLQVTNARIEKLFNDFEKIIKANRHETDQAILDVAAQVQAFDARFEETNTKLTLQNNRINSIIALKSGSTTGDAELLDIRQGYNGLSYETAGDAVRAVGNEVKALRTSLAQYIDTQAIDGLHYDYTGDVGLMQPYMLYLTSNGEVIQDSGVQIISGSGGGGGGGTVASALKINYITTSPVVVTTSDTAILRFTFSGTDSAGDTVAQAAATWKVGGKVVEYRTVYDGENEFDVTKYLEVGTTKVSLAVTDDNGAVATKTWSVQQIELAVESSFKDMLTYEAGKELVFNYTPYGAIDKTAIFILDGQELGRVPLTSDVSGREMKYTLPAQEHGSHLLEVYLEAMLEGRSEPVPSNRITKDILWYDTKGATPVIGAQAHNIKVKQYSTTNIIYTIYDPSVDTPTAQIAVDGVVVATSTLTANQNYNNTPTGVYSYMGASIGIHKIKIICGKTVKEITVEVESLGIEIAPVTDGLVFDFNPVGRSNEDTQNRLWNYGNIKLSVSDNFDWTNGGYIPDDPDGPCFCIKAGSTATISHKLFEDNARQGKEFKLIFKTKNVANTDAIFLSCLNNTTANDHIGLKMGVHTANVYGKSGNLELAYSEDDVIEFEFNISSDTDKVPVVMGYEDGVPSRPMVYNDTYSFTQSDPKELVFGSPDCDLYIYRLRVYNVSLSATDILNNFIADARTAPEMISRYNRNQIYDENNKLTPEVLAEKCPWLRVYKVSAPYFTNHKDDKVPNTTIQQIYKNGDPILDNWICYNAQHSGQGTSSNNYGAAGRNLDFIMNKSDTYFVLGDGNDAVKEEDKRNTNKITLTRESVPVDYLNAKVNIASSNNLTNAMLAARYNKFNPYERPFVPREASSEYFTRDANNNLIEMTNIPVEYIKDTMEFHNCVIFIQETDPDFTAHREFADNNWHFYAIGNIGDSKKTDNTRLTDPEDIYECCVELMDVELPLSDFPIDTMYNAMGYNVNPDTNEREYIWAVNKNLDKLYELKGTFIPTSDTEVVRNKAYYNYNPDTNVHKCVAYPGKNDLPNLYELQGHYELTTDTEINLDKTYYVDILEHDDYSEDFTYGWRFSSNKKNSEITDYCKSKWNEFYRFVTRSTNEEFVNYLENYFVKDSALFYYLFTTRYCMVDNRAKNTFWHYSKTGGKYENDINIYSTDGNTLLFSAKAGDDIRKWDLCWDYDNDTSLGLNNYGKQVYRYGLEDTDVDDNGEEVFREMDSAFFCKIRDCFSEDLKTMYNTLESKNAWHAESFINACDDWQSEFPEELWRLDIDRKYIRTYTSSFINGKGDAQFLTNMSNGKMKYHRRQWERSQEKYMASKYQTTTAAGDNSVFRCAVPSGNLAVAPNYQLTLTPFDYMYLNVKYSTGNPIQVKATPNVPTLIPFQGDGTDIINIYSSSSIKDFGDLSPCYPETADTAKAARIRKLTLGTDVAGYTNPGFTTLTTGSNPLLEELDIENVTGLTQALDLKELINLDRLYAFGTGVPSVSFAKGGKLSYAELPAVNNITLKNLQYLSTNNLKLSSFGQVTELIIEECPLIDQFELFQKCSALTHARLMDINFGNLSRFNNFMAMIEGIKGRTAANDETAYAVFDGTVKFEYVTGAEFNVLAERYPLLEVAYDTLESIITFKNTDLDAEPVHQATVFNAADYRNPVFYGEGSKPEDMIDKPIKNSSDEFDYEFVGWALSPNIILSTENPELDLEAVEKVYRENTVKKVEGDRILYPVFKSIRRSYPVTFINPTTEAEPTVVYTLYGYDAVYNGQTPKKEDAVLPDIYEFTGWYPKPEKIKGPTTCYAQFSIIDSKWYTLTLDDISEYKDYNGNDRIGYSLDYINNTMAITKNKNTFNPAIRVPEKFTVAENAFTVIKLGGFSSNTRLELIILPDSILELTSTAFEQCSNLAEITLPKFLQKIGGSAFHKCNKIKTFEIPSTVTTIDAAALAECASLTNIIVDPDNPYFVITNDCLVDTRTGLLIQGLSSGSIPNDGSIQALGNYCFASTSITDIVIPDTITTISSNAFSSCSNLVTVSLPETLTTLRGTCFAWCKKLANISLPKNLTEIGTYAFSGCALTDLVIPASVDKINEQAFSEMPSLRTVTFEKRIDADGNIVAPFIHKDAFINSGGEEGITFHVPWSADYDCNYTVSTRNPDGTYTNVLVEVPTGWGAKNVTMDYNYSISKEDI